MNTLHIQEPNYDIVAIISRCIKMEAEIAVKIKEEKKEKEYREAAAQMLRSANNLGNV